MEMHQLRYFVAVAEERHFGRAALREHVSQPPLSLQIQKLEQQMGVKLFERTRRSVEITEAGEALLPVARQILSAAKEAKDLAQRAYRGASGLVTIGFVHSASFTYLPQLIGPFRAAYPQAEIILKEMTVSEQHEALERGTIDIGIARPPVFGPELVSFPVQKEPFRLAVPSSHPFAERASVALSELADEPLVFYPRHRSPAFYDQLMRIFAAADVPAPRIAVEANTMYTAIGLVGTGAGLAIVPKSVTAIALTSLAYVDLKGVSELAELHLFYRGDVRSRGAHLLIAFARSSGDAVAP